jgi:hypothetical protein
MLIFVGFSSMEWNGFRFWVLNVKIIESFMKNKGILLVTPCQWHIVQIGLSFVHIFIYTPCLRRNWLYRNVVKNEISPKDMVPLCTVNPPRTPLRVVLKRGAREKPVPFRISVVIPFVL